MKKNSIIVLSLAVVLTMMIIPVSAKNFDLRANGKVIGGSVYPDAVFGEGTWHIKVSNFDALLNRADIEFKVVFKETLPTGAVNHYTVTMESVGFPSVVPGESFVTLDATFNVDIMTIQPKGVFPRIEHTSYQYKEGNVWFYLINSPNFHLDVDLTIYGLSFAIYGTITSIK